MTNLLTHAYQAGYSASQSRRDRSECPLFSMGPEGYAWRKEWRRGFDAHEAEYRRKYPSEVVKKLKKGKVP